MTDAIVLCYHAVSPSWQAALSTTPERFEEQIALLARRGFRGTTFSQIANMAAGGKTVAVTFDDAYRSVLELAQPILERYDVPATVFAPTDGVDAGRPLSWPGIDKWHGGPHEHELMPMSWNELASLVDRGWEIGSHTVTHPHLTQLADAALRAELVNSRVTCEERLGRPCETLAYPYGDADRRVASAAGQAGYAAAAALPGRLGSRDRLAWPRIGVYFVDDPRRFRLKVSPLVRRLRQIAAGGAAAPTTLTGRRSRARAV